MNRRLTTLTFAIVTAGAAVYVTACSYDWSTTAGQGLGDAAIDAPSAPSRDATGDGAEGSGRCRSSQACAANQYCDFADGACGQGGVGFCTPRTGNCPPDPAGGTPGTAVCGCSGKTYESACKAAAAGDDVSSSAARCGPDGGVPNPSSPCGDKACAADQYCVVRTNEPAKCTSFSPTCTSRDCNCPEVKDIGCACTGTPPTIRVECP